jgi:hypothetical protein
MGRGECDKVTNVKAILLLLAIPAVASAEPLHADSWDELGILRSQIDLSGGNTVEGVAVRFGPRVPVTQNVYVGGELDTGTLSGRVTNPTAFRTTGSGGEMQPGADLSGKFGAVRAIVGVRVRFGIVSAAGEFALGAHAAELHDQYLTEVDALRSDTFMMEGRARVDLWVSPRFTLGGTAGVDLADARNTNAGIMLGYHFGNYDGMR